MKTFGRLPCFRAHWLAITLLTMGHLGWANDAGDKARVNKARAEADAVLAAQEAECRQRFVVNACLIEVRRQHRAVVEPLREELIQIDERQRKQRAVDRADRIRAKADKSESASGSNAAPASAPVVASPRPAPRPMIRTKLRSISPASGDSSSAEFPADTPVVASPDASADVDSTVMAPARTSRRLTPMPNPNAMKQSTDRMREIEDRRDRVLKRNAERATKKSPAAPLPVPAAPVAAASDPQVL